MLSLGLSLTGAAVLRGGGTPTPTPTYLPTVTTAPNMTFGTYRGVAAYAGAAIRIQKSAVDTTQTDIAFAAGGYIDTAAVLTFTGGSTIDGTLVCKVYDQSGSGNDIVQATAASMPVLSTALNGKPTITFSGFGSMTIPAGYSSNAQALSIFMLGRYCGGTIFQSGTGVAFVQNSSSGLRLGFGNSSRAVSTYHYQNRAITHMTSSASTLKIGQDGILTAAASAAAASTLTGGQIGNSSVASTGGVLDFELLAVYPAGLSDTDAGSVVTNMRAMGGTITTGKTKRLVLGEDSLTDGTGATFNRNRAYYMLQTIGDTVKVYNRGKGGRALSVFAATDYAAQVAGIYQAGETCTLAVLGGINDLVGGQTASQIETSLQTLSTAVRSTGWNKFVVYDLPVSSSDGAEQAAFNTWLDANYATYADAKVNLRNSAIGGGSGVWPAFYFDSTHPNSAGYAVWAPFELTTIAP